MLIVPNWTTLKYVQINKGKPRQIQVFNNLIRNFNQPSIISFKQIEGTPLFCIYFEVTVDKIALRTYFMAIQCIDRTETCSLI